jgi:hypothetical protein
LQAAIFGKRAIVHASRVGCRLAICDRSINSDEGVMNFRVGQKVVCIYAHAEDAMDFGISVGEVYTISGYGRFGRLFLYDLAEIKTSEAHAWKGEHFRPVAERKTDISVFTAMLNPEKQEIEA